jgi:hypothetical protein
MATDIYKQGFDAWLRKGENVLGDAPLGLMSGSGIDAGSSDSVLGGGGSVSMSEASSIGSGEIGSLLGYGKKTFTDTANGWLQGLDTDNIFKWIIGTSGNSIDWSVTSPATLTISGVGIVSPTISFGRTSLTDSVHSGYFLGATGVYIGAAGDTSLLKYTVADGSFDFIGTASGRSTVTLAAAINASGNLITDIINVRLDTSTKKMLAGFTFGTADYAGALNSGTITWNTTTGALTGGTGVLVYRGGIIGASSGVAKFTLDSATGDATFAGTLSAAAGTLGSITAGTFTGTTFQTSASGARVIFDSSGI